MPKLTGEAIAQHNSKESCWVIVHGKAYDVTEFLPGEPQQPSSPAAQFLLQNIRKKLMK